MTRKYASWDIETHKIISNEELDGKNIMDFRPLGITCISLMCTGWEKPTVYYSGWPEKPLPRKMNKKELMEFAEELWAGCVSGYTPLAWNGNFDFQILMEELEGEFSEEIKMMARNSVDPMYQLFCIKGFPLGLETAANGMNIKGKTEGMHGDLAPEMWQNGTDEDRQKVLEYVGQDAVVPLHLVEKIEKLGLINWIAKSGRSQVVRMSPLLTVKEARQIPEPDTSWMSNPIPRSNFYGWAFELDPAKMAPENKYSDTDILNLIENELQHHLGGGWWWNAEHDIHRGMSLRDAVVKHFEGPREPISDADEAAMAEVVGYDGPIY